ncbi:MAG TPA: LysM peptidoglycan-binding domain-containing protein [Solirubrobacteraceae bacterium]|nr:LysM peptidoglycan-binding domain-containing protein [Solirubrobacteraceae bacterium]
MRVRASVALAIAVLAGTLLAVPSPASAFNHVVAPGESLSSVAATDGVTVEELAAANGLSGEAQLVAGSDLTIPAQGSEAGEPGGEATGAGEPGGEATGAGEPGSDAPPTEAAQSSPSAGGGYLVEPGDTLSSIAARDGTTVEALASANGLDPAGTLLSGTVLDLPGGSPEAVGTPAGAEAPPYPTEETVSPSEVGSIAEEHGISPSLAEAVAEQESGFNNGLTSSTDARGVMQIEPETWSYISRDLAGPPPLQAASASSNVRGGVLLLQQLLNETGGDPVGAVAGYFQGLESVRRHGEYPETEAYVDSVLALQRRFAGE